jgi:hypothetical protein
MNKIPAAKPTAAGLWTLVNDVPPNFYYLPHEKKAEHFGDSEDAILLYADEHCVSFPAAIEAGVKEAVREYLETHSLHAGLPMRVESAALNLR